MVRIINKIKLINAQTPIVKLNKMVGSTSIYMKRDDLIDFYFGGNKVRLYEYIAADVIERNVDKLITFGSIHSNHVRVTTAVASYLGLECDIIIIRDDNKFKDKIEGNRLMVDFIGVNKYFCSTENAREYIDEHLSNQKAKGVNYYFVPGGGHTAIATMAYSDLMEEILEQSLQLNVNFDAIFLPTGTGTTQAGLVHGKKRFGFEGEILGITVARNTNRCQQEIMTMLTELTEKTRENIQFDISEINVLDNNKKYGVIDDEIIQLMKKIGKADGILLDPIYNAKSFLAMEKQVEQGKKYDNVLYLNTGGTPNIFIDEVQRKVGL